MQSLRNMHSSRELAGGKGRVKAEKKQGKKSMCKAKGLQTSGRQQQDCGRLKILLLLNGLAFCALLGSSRLTQTVQTFTITRQTIPGTPPGSFAVAFGKTAGDKGAGQLSYQGKSCRGWLGTGLGKNLCCMHKS